MYTALKPCLISGNEYLIGDAVDVSMLSVKDIAALVKRKVIIEAGDKKTSPASDSAYATVDVPIIDKDNNFVISLTVAQICETLSILQMTAEQATEAIGAITDENQLILTHRVDSRVTVKKAAKERAEAISAAAKAGKGE